MKLNRCPRCGKTAMLRAEGNDGNDNPQWYYVQCRHCYLRTCDHFCRQDAEIDWNWNGKGMFP